MYDIAHDVAVKVAMEFAIALLLISRNKNMQEHIKTCVFLKRFDSSNMHYICFE